MKRGQADKMETWRTRKHTDSRWREKNRRAKEKTWQQTSEKKLRNVGYELFAVGGIRELEIQRKMVKIWDRGRQKKTEEGMEK